MEERRHAEERFSVYCECADEDCRTEVWLTLGEWDAAKARPNRIVIALGHPLSAGEAIVHQTDRFAVAEGGVPPV
jgi:hypothetical protein